MLNKTLTAGLAILIIVMGVFIGNVLSEQKPPVKTQETQQAKKSLKTLAVQNTTVARQFEISGMLSALNQIELYAEVSGVLQPTDKAFKEGVFFSKGETLIQIDDEVYRNNLLAEKSELLNQLTALLPDLAIDYPNAAGKWNQYLNEFEIEKPLKPLPQVDSQRERNYVAARNIYTNYYQVKSMEATLAKYSLKAPYAGIVTESLVNPGALIRTGQQIGEFTNTSVYELEATADLEDVEFLKIGENVKLTSDDFQGTFQGKIQRINKKITPETQTVNVFIYTSDPRLKDGMYLSAKISTQVSNAIEVPRSLLVDKRKLYVLENSIIRLKQVEIAGTHGDKAIVKGLENGTLILTETFDGLKDGLQINPSEYSLQSSTDNALVVSSEAASKVPNVQ
ncbi:efflux transporter, RND family, MFP subunit [Chloroherpeton thalassium ATCC 35110]|uniref:Efflux transporter, RND family, MFP subunit n=1 Tax=Chloroherpeton thalassium (strain ATCC 35110 / GB-78) TaxID=517418 RepID=B3QYK1_CHLT3|nr:efflux RND transporter periplasmic adaptor subunit [Chloroherpeton thalassium]ACF13629.1 efflux transporter, RND family, MFP subunit [Chloroherpeton thalassium ATCC 35110]